MIEGILDFIANLLNGWLARRKAAKFQNEISKGNYDAKAAEAKELAKPDTTWADTVKRL